ncbi:hypothetical protein EUGRSUZ_J01894 [Eucalyptus grandis]|uniref:Uncharacterized protein n=3 Tax=Eucalyptus grandis TaxID=71139 RepID=A0ACC3J6Z3_EUCGR|nr:hypothetical protein EUGRSUZ_J01894 [Eucalyptus grandis]
MTNMLTSPLEQPKAAFGSPDLSPNYPIRCLGIPPFTPSLSLSLSLSAVLRRADPIRSDRLLLPPELTPQTAPPAMASSEPEREHREDEEAQAGDDEDTGAQVAPIVKLEEVAVTTGEEDEDAILDLKAKLYRFDKDGRQWKERGAGTVKFLKHKETGKVRLVMRQSKTLKICANHLVISTMTVQEHSGNDKSCVWHATDFADGELKDEYFCIRFGSVENCKTFLERFQEVAESQKKNVENKDASSAAGLLEKLSVEEKKSEDKAGKELASASEGEKETKSEEKPDADKKTESSSSA